MDRKEFLARISALGCARCPIKGYCRMIKTVSCRATAGRFFQRANRDGQINWQDIMKLEDRNNGE